MVRVADYRDRIGQMLLYRNKILTRLLEEEEKEFPNMNTIAEETERFVDIQDQIDNETISLLAKIEQDKVSQEDKRKMREDEEKLQTIVVGEDEEDEEDKSDEEGGEGNFQGEELQEVVKPQLEDQGEPTGDWLVAVLNNMDLNESQKNYLKILKDKGGFRQATEIRKDLNMKKNTGQNVENGLEENGAIKSMNLGDRKFVFLNHSVFNFVDTFQQKLDEVIEGVLKGQL